MAVIPSSEDLGRRLAEPTGLVGAVPSRAFGQPFADAVGAVGAMEMHAEAQQQQRLMQDAREQEQAWKVAQRAKAMDVLQSTQADLAALHDDWNDGIRTGRIAKDKAGEEWTAATQDRIGKALENVPVEWRQNVQRGLESDAARLTRGVNRAVLARNRADVTGSLDSILEAEARNYGRDPAGSAARVQAALGSLGPESNYDAAQLGKKGQAWLESAQYTTAFSAVTGARQDPAALAKLDQQLRNPEFMPALDPQRRAELVDRTAGYRLHLDQQAELRAQRAEREAERHLKKAEAAFGAWQAVADKGTVVSPAFVEQTIQATAGTPYQAAVRATMETLRETGGAARQPISQQRAQLDALDTLIARNGLTPELSKRRDQLQKVLDGSLKDAKDDPLRAGAERGLLPDGLKPLDLSGGIAGLGPQVAARVQQADIVQSWAGTDVPVSPFTPQEASQIGTMLRTLPLDGQEAALATLSTVIPRRQAAALAKQIDAQDRGLALALSAGGAMTSEGRTVAKLILRGQQAIKDKASKEDVNAEFGVRASIAKEVGDALSGPSREAVIDAARFIYMGKQAAGERVSFGGAVALAAGGPIVEHAGRKIPVPAGVDINEAIKRVTPQQISEQLRGSAPPKPPSMIEGGNIDLNRRPTVNNADGSFSTIESMSANINGVEVLMPTITPDGKRMTEQQAVDRYLKTGEHLGKFRDPREADAYAQALSKSQGDAYMVYVGGKPVPVADFVSALPDAQLEPVSLGRYMVRSGGHLVNNAARRPIVIELR